MAKDEALAASVGAGAEGALRIYSFAPPCVSYGRSQEEPGTLELAAFEADGIEFVRRPTGGLSLLHMDDFTYCLVLPTSAGIDREECFALAAGGLTGALALLDVPSAVATHEPAGRRSRWCFESAFGVDIESRGRKVCGSAQRVYRDSILQHGTLILSGGHGAMLDSLGQEGAENVLLPLDEAAGHPVTWNEVRHALEESFSKGIGLELEPAWMDAHEDKYVRDLLDETRAAKGL